jgi:hypothetical protein
MADKKHETGFRSSRVVSGNSFYYITYVKEKLPRNHAREFVSLT